MSDPVALSIDGHELAVPEGTTIWEAARTVGIDIPVLCHDPRLPPIGVCRLCLVDTGEKKLAASCVRVVEEGMEVATSNPKLEACRTGLLELLLADYPPDAMDRLKTGRDELFELAEVYGIEWDGASDVGGIPAGDGRPVDASSPVIHVNHQACILCDRCIRACDDVQVNEVIGRTGKGYGTRISFDLDDPMGNSTCVACGECEKVCPTGALSLTILIDEAS